jgi:uncharacterized DUF497 family protein
MIVIRRLVWDPRNVEHIARHQVTPREVEQVCQGVHIVRRAYDGRIMLIGPTRAGRVLAVVLEPETEAAYYPVTARPASRKERRVYREETQGETHD